MAERLPNFQLVDENGYPTKAFIGWLRDERERTADKIASVDSVVNDIDTRLSNEITDRQNAVNAVANAGDGTGTTDADNYSGVSTSGTTWVTAVTNTVTPTGAGSYTFSVNPSLSIGALDAGTSFTGAWRIVEEQTGGGTPVTKASGTFAASYTPASTAPLGEGSSEVITIPAVMQLTFNSLPAAPITSSYAVQADLRFEIQRTSGSNNATGLAGSMSTSWA